MWIYLLKSSACLLLFFLFYKFLLEGQSNHQFKRFYLLGTLVLALVIPMITFTNVEYIEIYENPEIIPATLEKAENYITANNTSEFHWRNLALILYLLILTPLVFTFFRGLFTLLRRIQNNEKIQAPKNTKVLVNEPVVPHTFLRYIFLEGTAYTSGSIPKLVVRHEESHASQWHSIDVLLVELLCTLFWFQPLFWYYKKAIKLNHEFLADQAVLKSGTSMSDYQNILLRLSTKGNQPALANAINYSSIKKRMLVMKTQSKISRIRLKLILLLPLTAMLIWGFSSRHTEYREVLPAMHEYDTYNISEEIQKELDQIGKLPMHMGDVSWKLSEASIELKIDAQNTIYLDDQEIQMSHLAYFIEKKVKSLGSKLKNPSIIIEAKSGLSMNFLDKIVLEIHKTGVFNIVVKTPEYIIPENAYQTHVEQKPKTVKLLAGKIVRVKELQEGASRDEMRVFNQLAEKYNALPRKERLIPLDELRSLETIYRNMSAKQKADAQPFPECDLEEIYIEEVPDMDKSIQDGASREQMKEYNVLAKKYNEMDRNYMRIDGKEVARLKYIYGIMSKKQQEDAEPFPDFPPPPPAPEAPVSPGAASPVSAVSPPQPSQPPTPSAPTAVGPPNASTPPPPTPPKSPQQLVKELAAKDGTFYYNGKKISVEGALKVLNNSKNIQVRTQMDSNSKPVMYIEN